MAKWKIKRKQAVLEMKEYNYFIFCEGEQTEPNYYKGFESNIENNPIYKDMVTVKVQGCGKETLRVVEDAQDFVQKNKIKNAKVFCVFDKDDFPAKDFNYAISCMEKLNKNKNDVIYHAAWSNQCIELWFLLHFSYYHSNNDRKQYFEALDNILRKRGLNKYKKNDDLIFDILYEHGNPKQAIIFAKKLMNEYSGTNYADMSPATKVYELVEELSKYLPEEMKIKF